VVLGYGLSVYANLTVGSAKYQTGPNYPNGGLWVANTPGNVEGIDVLWQHRNFDVGLVYKRVGQYYQDNGTLNYKINGITVPYPVNQAFAIRPWDLVNVFFNYTLKNTSYLRGTKLQLAVNNLADNHNLVGITPAVAATATTRFVQSPNDLLNLLPGRSITLTITGGYAPRR
jgi:iron complex outermembrane receptor protein